MSIKRHLLTWALAENVLRDRMSFIAGPRQIGKTTAVQEFLAGSPGGSAWLHLSLAGSAQKCLSGLFGRPLDQSTGAGCPQRRKILLLGLGDGNGKGGAF